MGGIGRVGRVLVKKDSVLFFITVRTLWNEMQRSLMRTVGKEADLIKDEDHENRLLIIDESSVVSLHSENQKTDFQDVRLDDKYIICDPGGDTVNILTFETVESLTSDYADTLRRCHLAADFSEGCSSTFIGKKCGISSHVFVTTVCLLKMKEKKRNAINYFLLLLTSVLKSSR